MNSKIDTLHHVEIPEGVDLQAELSGLVPRALAYSIGLLIRGLVLTAFLIVASIFNKAGTGLWLILFFMLEWLYPVYYELFHQGQTPGKKSLGIKVVAEELTPIQLQASLIRNLLRAVDFLPFCYVLGILSLVISGKFQRLGDLAAGTVVIYKPDTEQANSIDIPVPAIVHHGPLTEEQQSAIIQFAQNRGGLSQARQQEIAEILRDLIPPTHKDSVAYLQGVGKWLLGGRETS